jgi:hypothetical protein
MRTSKTAALLCLALLCVSCAIGRTTDTSSGNDEESNTTSGVQTTSVTTGGSTSGGTTPTPGTTQDGNDNVVAVSNSISNYTTIGRFYAANANALQFALPASQIGGRFTGTSLAVKFADTGYDYFDVILDGNTWVSTSFSATGGCLPVAQAQAINSNANAVTGCVRSVPATTPQTYVIATNLSPGNHTAWLIKRTEMYQGTGTSAVGQSTFYGFVLDANATLLTPPKANTRRIDFIGDSGFTGYGAGQLMHNANDYCDFTPANQDAAASVPYLTGQLLHADAINVSSSGQGVVDGVYDSNPNHLLPVLYEEILPPAASPAYAFTTQVDVVVIAGGGDDLNGASGSGSFTDPNAFVAGYASWLEKIRAHYPNALLVCTLTSGAQSADITTLGGALQQAVQMRKTAGDTKVVYYSFFMNETSFTTYTDIASKCSFYYGCKYHPSPAGALWLANRLATFIRGQTGWTD